MVAICFLFEVHQPLRLNWFAHQGQKVHDYRHLVPRYFNMGLNRYIFDKVAGNCYWKANKTLLEVIDALRYQNKKFKISYSLSGTFIEQAKMFQPALLESFKQLAQTGCVEFLDETFYHSLSSLFDSEKKEFAEQVEVHRGLMKDLFGQEPKVFRNTELLYNNAIAKKVEEMGYDGIFAEGVDRLLGWRSPNYLYRPKGCSKLKLFLRNYRLSDDVGYRFSSRHWEEWPLTAEKYSAWLASCQGDVVNLCMDYETFGEHQWESTGIFWFLKALPYQILKHDNLSFVTPSEAAKKFKPVGEVDVFEYNTISWADIERDTSAWLGNRMQQSCYSEIQALEKYVKATENIDLIHAWRLLQTSDHYYYLCTKWWSDGDVHHYFSHMKNPYEGFANFASIIADLRTKVYEYLMKNNIKVDTEGTEGTESTEGKEEGQNKG